MKRELIIQPDPAAVARRMAADAAALLREAGPDATFHLGLSGGSVATAAFPELVRELSGDPAALPRIHAWFVDERFVPAGHEERSIGPIEEALHGAPAASAFLVYPAPASDEGADLDEAARRYAQEITEQLPASAEGLPIFDLLLLGAGPDGHTASLFPGRPEIGERDAIVLPVRDSPKPPPERVTLSLPVITASRRAWLLATGTAKAEAIALAHAGASPAESPIGAAIAREQTRWYLDEAAAGNLS